MTLNAMTEHYEEITVCGKPALFTSIRIKRDTIPDGLYAYDVRHDDECRGIPCEIAPFVISNIVVCHSTNRTPAFTNRSHTNAVRRQLYNLFHVPQSMQHL